MPPAVHRILSRHTNEAFPYRWYVKPRQQRIANISIQSFKVQFDFRQLAQGEPHRRVRKDEWIREQTYR
jgi:hypothetical protein